MDAYVLRTSVNPRSPLLIDISDNTARGKVIQRLISAAAAKTDNPTLRLDPPLGNAPQPGLGGGGQDRYMDAAMPTWSAQDTTYFGLTPLSMSARPNSKIADVWQHLNSLRVMAQYTRTLGVMCDHHPFLHAHPSTCVIGLEWLSRFVQPLQQPSPDAQESLGRSIDLFCKAQAPSAGNPTKERATFEYHARTACSDRDLTRLLITQHFPTMDCKEYHADVCAYMLSRGGSAAGMGYEEWLATFPTWRDTGLFFPLALSAVYMPHIEAWLPEDKLDTAFAITFQNCLNSLGRPELDPAPALKTLASVWASDKTGSSSLIAVTLDRIAVLMGIKSNGSGPGEFNLAAALASFPRSFGDEESCMHKCNYRAWHSIRAAVESTFPPSLLLAPCVCPKRPTWGHPRLTLQVATTEGLLPSVRFAETALQVVQPDAANEDPKAYVRVDRCDISVISPSFHRDCLLNQTSFRIQDVLWRLGEFATSPGVAGCMLNPREARAALESGAPPPKEIDRSRALQGMARSSDHSDTLKIDPEYLAYARALDATVPPVNVTHFSDIQSALMWRLDIPSRAIIYIGAGGDDIDPAAESQHHLRKVLVNSKVPQRPIGGIVKVPPRSDESALRECIRQFAATELAGHPSNTVLVKGGGGGGEEADGVGKRQVTPVTCTTLAESAACFALRAPSKISTCPLGGSCAWKENGIDPRYAERQQAQNGARYRDWAAMHAGKGGTQQSRLASHFVEYDSLYTTKMPWIQLDESQPVKWVTVSSTAPPESKTLHGNTLRQAVEGRFLHDLRMLPAHDLPDSGGRPKIERANTEIYSADAGAKIAVAYAPTGQDRIEFVAFECDADQ